MKQHRRWLAATIVWLFLLFNVERLFRSIDLASFVYALAAALAVSLLLSRRLRELPISKTITATWLVFVCVKCGLGYQIAAQDLWLTLVEAGAIAITAYLAAWVGRHTDQYTASMQQLLTMHHVRQVPTFDAADSALQREVRRARRFERPLSLVTLQADVRSVHAALPRFRQHLEAELVAHYANGQLGQLLLNETKSNDLVVRDGQRYLLLLPETEAVNAARLAERLQDRVRQCFGVELHSTVGQFPDDELTLSGLLERSVREPAKEITAKSLVSQAQSAP